MNIEALREFQRERDISQNEMARMFGISAATMSNIMSGVREPKLPVFKMMCKKVGKDPKELW